MYLAQVVESGEQLLGILIFETDPPVVRELKEFMAIYGIENIFMRMLKESELLPIQGFPVDYFDKTRKNGRGISATRAKVYIGNAVEVGTAKAMCECYGSQLVDT